jgi:hypothetical protein
MFPTPSGRHYAKAMLSVYLEQVTWLTPANHLEFGQFGTQGQRLIARRM